jgi:hypothetical protein
MILLCVGVCNIDYAILVLTMSIPSNGQHRDGTATGAECAEFDTANNSVKCSV